MKIEDEYRRGPGGATEVRRLVTEKFAEEIRRNFKNLSIDWRNLV